MLESQHFQLFLPLQQRNMVQLKRIETKPVHVGFSFTWPSIANPDIGNLRQFSEYDVAIFLYLLEVSVLQEIAKSLILFVKGNILKDLIFGHFFLRIDLISFGSNLNFGRSLRHFLFILGVEGWSKFLICFRHHNSNIILTNLSL